MAIILSRVVSGACVACGCPTGACCTGTTCSQTTETACTEAGGTWMGDGTPCSPNPCCAPCELENTTFYIYVDGGDYSMGYAGTIDVDLCEGFTIISLIGCDAGLSILFTCEGAWVLGLQIPDSADFATYTGGSIPGTWTIADSSSGCDWPPTIIISTDPPP